MNNNSEINKAIKHDKDKLRYDLIPTTPLEELAGVFTFGANKYGEHNWRNGLSEDRCYAAMMRHLEAWRKNNKLCSYQKAKDEESGLHHLAHVAWYAFVLIEYEKNDSPR